MEEEIRTGEVKISRLKGKLTVNLVEKILFESGSAEIKPQGLEVLKKVGKVLKNVNDKNIVVEGHTDNIPISSRLRPNLSFQLGTLHHPRRKCGAFFTGTNRHQGRKTVRLRLQPIPAGQRQPKHSGARPESPHSDRPGAGRLSSRHTAAISGESRGRIPLQAFRVFCHRAGRSMDLLKSTRTIPSESLETRRSRRAPTVKASD